MFQAEIHMLHVLPSLTPVGYPGIDYHSETLLRDAEEESHEKLSVMIEKKIHNQKKLVRVIRRGDPLTEILNFVKHENMDLIVMATHGRTGLVRALLGSVAEEVIRRSTVPVLAVKPSVVVQKLQKEIDVPEASRIHEE